MLQDCKAALQAIVPSSDLIQFTDHNAPSQKDTIGRNPKSLFIPRRLLFWKSNVCRDTGKKKGKMWFFSDELLA